MFRTELFGMIRTVTIGILVASTTNPATDEFQAEPVPRVWRALLQKLRRSEKRPFWCAGLLRGYGIQISIDDAGCWRDNVFVKRLWRSVKTACALYKRQYLSVLGSFAGSSRHFTSITTPSR